MSLTTTLRNLQVFSDLKKFTFINKQKYKKKNTKAESMEVDQL